MIDENENNKEPFLKEEEDSEEVDERDEGTEFHRSEQDEGTVSKDTGLPSPSTR